MSEDRLRYLFLRYVENTCTQAELQELFALTNNAKTDERLKALMIGIYEEIKQSHLSFTYVDSTGNIIFNEPPAPAVITETKNKQRAHIRKIFVVAASLVLAALITWTVVKKEKPNEVAIVQSTTKKFTEKKEQKFLLLPDSTQVWLNVSSTLEFPDKFSKDKREVTLTGEAFFDVMHADKIPFLIHTGKVTTTVLGTAFNIKAYQDQKEIIVSVTRGRVKVSRDNVLLTTLTKGQIVRISRNSEKTIQKDLPVETISGWQQGNLIYEEMNLGDIVKDLQNVYNVQIEIKDTATANLNITTAFNRDIGAERALDILARLTRRTLVKHNDTLILE